MNILAANNFGTSIVEGFVIPNLKIEKVTTNRMREMSNTRGVYAVPCIWETVWHQKCCIFSDCNLGTYLYAFSLMFNTP